MLTCVCFTTSDSGEIPVEDELVAVVGIVVVIVSIFIVVTVGCCCSGVSGSGVFTTLVPIVAQWM